MGRCGGRTVDVVVTVSEPDHADVVEISITR
jgi:hypothetical protein